MRFLSGFLLIGTILSGPMALAASPDAADWPQYNYDNRGWRFNVAEKQLGPNNVSGLVEKWRFPARGSGETIGAVHTTPVVVNGFTYAGSARSGVLYKLSPKGKLVWKFTVPQSKHALEYRDTKGATQRFGEGGVLGWIITNSPLVTNTAVFLTTSDGRIFSLDRFTGTQRWVVETRVEPFPGHHIVNCFWSSPILADGKLIVAGGAAEQGAAAFVPDYECCSGRGFIAALNPQDGSLLWKYDLGVPPEKLDPPLVVNRSGMQVKYTHGPSTSTIWSTPTFDPDSQLIYFGTDTNNSPRRPTPDDARESTKHSCAIVAVDVRTGHERWVRQLVENDVWYGLNPGWDPKTGQYKDLSIGDSPKIYDVEFEGRVRQVVSVGCKDGGFYVLDRATGEIVHHTTLYKGPPEPERIADADAGILAMPSAIGGLQTGCAYDGQRVYTNGIDWLGSVRASLSPNSYAFPPAGGRVCAVRGNALSILWRHERPQVVVSQARTPGRKLVAGDPVASGICVANGVAYFSTAQSHQLVAVNCSTGNVLAEIPLEPLWSGPSVSRGRVFIGTGNSLWAETEDDVPAEFGFIFPIESKGAITSFGLPGQDELDQMPESESPDGRATK